MEGNIKLFISFARWSVYFGQGKAWHLLFPRWHKGLLGGTEEVLMVGSRGGGRGGPRLSEHQAEGGSTPVTSSCLC